LSRSGSEQRVLLLARGLRGIADGMISLVLPAYLLALGYGAVETGLIATATLAGSAALTLTVGLYAHRADGRTLLMAASILMALTGTAFALFEDFWPLLLVALVGTLNPSAGDVSVFLPLEQAQLAGLAGTSRRTRLFARYSFVGALAGSLGALAAGLPEMASQATGIGAREAWQGAFLAYAATGRRPCSTGACRGTSAQRAGAPLGPSKRIVFTLAALFSRTHSPVASWCSRCALWLLERFGLSLMAAGTIFFWTGLLSAFSYFAAARLAERFGLINTMVFSHLPANLCLAAVPFVGDLRWAIALLMVRSALSQMDVPTRTSYVMSVVSAAERPAAATFTAVPRSLASAASPALAGSLLAASGFGWPLVIAGGLKIVYDLVLLALFRHRPPLPEPEEGE
jgi:MFS family permease